jgi:hypothetical protein
LTVNGPKRAARLVAHPAISVEADAMGPERKAEEGLVFLL